ncbi:Arm DNA-binding domain-containing protein [Enterobacter asburiae]|uniref:Arm DNA-binding domain-containing protein n=1 Tax=Enterobacter asburiae TaxID=61645 RepID=UPI003A95453A
MTLNARQVETAKPRDKAYKLADGGGLYLMVNTNGSKYWRMKYRFAGKEKKLSFGTYPDISLSEARTNEMRQERYWRMIRIPERTKKPRN